MKTANKETFNDLVDQLRATQSWKELDYGNKQLANLLGCSERTLYRWIAGDTAVPLTVILLLKMLLNQKESA